MIAATSAKPVDRVDPSRDSVAAVRNPAQNLVDGPRDHGSSCVTATTLGPGALLLFGVTFV